MSELFRRPSLKGQVGVDARCEVTMMRNAMAGMMFATLAMSAGEAAAQTVVDGSGLLRLVQTANELCRGGTGDSIETEIACEVRDDLVRRLREVGWCYGEVGQAGYQMRWHRCNRRSNQYQLP
ncbi:hypothetical protein KPL78_04155 [Roseomonas sp. HJA6]|uniref:UrcA family protein n=1 Tax=Roseomonas alba TaxID=2846776 RepID=A0ABS7A6U0_9PROT|nr:hypothetical protein [Neoroseomonas alba]MBW6397025.1 hypothetical protein [Neoroseomonas alba]